MDLSGNFITRIIDEENITKATRSGITPTFLSEDAAGVLKYIERHFAEYKVVPSRDAVLRAYPNFKFSEDSTQPLDYYINELKESFRRNVLEDKLDEISRTYTDDTKRAEELLREALSELNVTQKTFRDVDAARTAIDRVQTYLQRKENPGADGILTGWPRMDYQTLGWHNEEFGVLVGEKYMGKSWALIWGAIQAAINGERVLFVTPEMSQEAVMRRFDAIYSRVCFDSLRRGELTYVEEQRFKEAMSKLAESSVHFITARQGISTIADIELKASETDASIVFADSAYLFDPDHSGKRYNNETHRMREVSQKCKSVATRMGVPFIVALQAGRRKTKERIPTLDDIEWSNSFAQDADVVYFLNKEEVDKELKRAHLYVLKCRDGDETNFFIHQDFQTMDFSERNDEVEPTMEVFDSADEGIFN